MFVRIVSPKCYPLSLTPSECLPGLGALRAIFLLKLGRLEESPSPCEPLPRKQHIAKQPAYRITGRGRRLLRGGAHPCLYLNPEDLALSRV